MQEQRWEWVWLPLTVRGDWLSYDHYDGDECERNAINSTHEADYEPDDVTFGPPPGAAAKACATSIKQIQRQPDSDRSLPRR